LRNQAVKKLFLDGVWSALSEDRWLSASELKAVCGADENTLTRVVEFLARWDFAEVRRSPSLQVRRKPGVISPMDVVQVLQAAQENPQVKPSAANAVFRLAERVACRACAGTSLRAVGGNEVECTTCGERQWFAIKMNRGFGTGGYEKDHALRRLLAFLSRR
jgi:hypothetical protein